MPSINVDENIRKIEQAIEELTQEVYRLQGSLRVFKGFKEAGLTNVDVPDELKESHDTTEEPQEVKLHELQDADESTQE